MRLATLSYWKVFRLIFVIFFLYLIGDAFYRWDGFRFYAPLSEFLPGFGLAAILCSIVVFFAAVLVWVSLRIMEWLFRKVRLKIRIEQVFIFLGVFSLLSIIILSGKIPKVSYLSGLLHWNIESLSVISIIALFLTWLFRNKAESLVNTVQDRITPLVWIFALFVIVSIPLVAYLTWWKGTVNIVSHKLDETYKANKNRPNILLVTFDALTSRDMSVYGYNRPTTPFITEWAKSASLFTKVEAESHITTPTTASLMTGKRLWTHQTYHIAGSSRPVKSETENLPLMLREHGYYNMAFIVNPFASVRKLGIAGSFDIAPIETGFSKQANLLGNIDSLLYQWFGNKIRLYNWIVQRDFILFKVLKKMSRNFSKTTAPPEKAFENFLMVFDSDPPTPFFAWIHLYPPHDPYLPPKPFMGMFDSSSYLRTFKSQDNAIREASRYHLKFKQFSPEVKPVVGILRDRYDEFIKYCDKQFETFISRLAKRNILNNTIIILSSDHGESFEHNYIKHSFNNLYEQVTHIPLIIKEPGQVEGRIIDDLTEQIDIPSTILDLANIPQPAWMEGRSLAPLMRGQRLPPKPAFSMALESQASRGNMITSGKIAVWEGNYKLIHQLENEKSLLFNLAEDPAELNNLFDKEPEIGNRLINIIEVNLKKANEGIVKEK
jgi:arylsulfatase A-like enzyme